MQSSASNEAGLLEPPPSWKFARQALEFSRLGRWGSIHKVMLKTVTILCYLDKARSHIAEL